MAVENPSSGPVVDKVTVLSLGASASLLAVAYILSLRVLPQRSSTRTRVLFIWHLFDSLTHFLFEGSFLYNCFFTFLPLVSKSSFIADTGSEPLLVTPPGVHFLGQDDRLYGAAYGSNPTAKLWQEYAKADKRWGGADLTVISLEILTVFLGGPISAYIGYLLSKGHGDIEVGGKKQRGFSGKLAFWMIALATGELYGGFMTFAPEWLSGNPNLDGSNWMYL
jgi:EXPERA (EXPanded EBP superfamily)